MSDATVTIAEIKELFNKFSKDRRWDKLNSPKDLSMDIVSEATELMGLFLFKDESNLRGIFLKVKEN
jgi:hypothetical protein